MSGEPSSLDPSEAVDTFSFEVLRDLYEGLTSESPSGDVVPGAASSWAVDAIGTTYTFQIRADARWSNGRPITAQQFVDSWQRAVDPKRATPTADNLRLIAGANAIIAGQLPVSKLGAYAQGSKVLVVKLEQPAPYLPQLLTHPSTYPIYSEVSAVSHSPTTWVSNGPYVLTQWSPGNSITLKRNSAYWDRANVRIAEVQYQVMNDESSQFARYRAGQLDMTDTVPASSIAEYHKSKSNELVTGPFLATAYYGLNLLAPPFASNVALRKAISMAIDRKRLVASLAFGQAPAYGFVAPGTWNYTPQSCDWKNEDDAQRIGEARRLYGLAGYSQTNPLHLELLYNSNPVIKNTAIIIAAMWKDTLGIDTGLREEEYRVFLESRHDKAKWQVVRLGWTADYNDASNFLNAFRMQSTNNDTGFANQKFNSLLDDAARTPDPARRRKLLESAETVLLEDYPVIPLYFYVSKRLVKPYVHGVTANPMNRVASKNLSIDIR